jgi:hypothetical protein
MRLGVARGDDFVAHIFRERNVHQPVAVNVAEFAVPKAKLQPAVSVRRNLHLLPPSHGLANSPLCSRHCHRSRYYSPFPAAPLMPVLLWWPSQDTRRRFALRPLKFRFATVGRGVDSRPRETLSARELFEQPAVSRFRTTRGTKNVDRTDKE